MHSTWVPVAGATDRWQLNQLEEHGGDGSRNHLLRDGERLFELHVSRENAWLHEYTGTVDDAKPFLLHGANVWHVESSEIPSLADADSQTAWAALERVARDG